jgi:small subunit ribosomal protein S2
MSRLPGIVYVVDTKKEKIAVAEANRLTIPIVAILDTNCDPDLVHYPIPGNDDAIKSIKLVTKLIADAAMEAKEKAAVAREEDAEGGKEKKKAREPKPQA